MWKVEYIDEEAKEQVDNLPLDFRAKFERITRMIKELGLREIREPYVKQIDRKLWEIRMIGREGIARSLYVTAKHKRVIVLHTFIKKTQKTPRREIDLALNKVGLIKNEP